MRIDNYQSANRHMCEANRSGRTHCPVAIDCGDDFDVPTGPNSCRTDMRLSSGKLKPTTHRPKFGVTQPYVLHGNTAALFSSEMSAAAVGSVVRVVISTSILMTAR